MHLLDVENLCGASLLTSKMVADLRARYERLVPIGPRDQFVLASAHISLIAMGTGWARARYEVGSGKDGADIRLAHVMLDENLPARFEHVFLGSGDGGLAPFAADLARQGTRVSAVSRMRSISPHMRLAVSTVIYLDSPSAAVALAA